MRHRYNHKYFRVMLDNFDKKYKAVIVINLTASKLNMIKTSFFLILLIHCITLRATLAVS